MLKSLYVKNLALIKESEISFKEGLNILSGETGAGKSMIIGSINLALGKRAESSVISKGAEYALIELCFYIDDEYVINALKDLSIELEDNYLTLTRRIYEGRSVCKINGETVSAATLKEAATYLIDIHGQHDNQSLLYPKNHITMLDKYAGDEIGELLDKCATVYKEYNAIKKKLSEEALDDKEKNRDISILEHEVNTILAANLKLGEDEELLADYQKYSNAQKIMQVCSAAGSLVSNDNEGAADLVSRALRELSDVSDIDDKLSNLYSSLMSVEDLLNDFNRELSSYVDDFSFDEAQFRQIESRLDLINDLKARFGNSIEEILAYAESAGKKLEKYSDYDAYIEKLNKELADKEKELEKICAKLSKLRTEAAKRFDEAVIAELAELNFDSPIFKTSISKKEEYLANGYDEVEFMIALNAGFDIAPLSKIASGGELSRIMLALKCVCTDYSIDTMIFDEIDTGISGRTALLMAKKLSKLGKTKQVMAITHLPQIAAAADAHFLIEKSVEGDMTSTDIRELKEQDEKIIELSRMLSGGEITEATKENALELINSAHS